MRQLQEFSNIWAIDFEFVQPDGSKPTPVCVVARELRSGRLIRRWQDDLTFPPFTNGPDSLFVAYYSSAEWNCFLALAWPLPVYVLDLYAEFRCLTCGLPTPNGWGLVGALTYLGLDAMDIVAKESMRELVMRGGPWTGEEQERILAYCQSDVDSLVKLMPAMLPKINFPQALLRGRYMKAAAKMEFTGVPINTGVLARLNGGWDSIQDKLISRIDRDYGVYDGQSFKADRFAAWLIRRGIAWPTLESGNLALDDDTFKDMAAVYPELSPLRELRSTLSLMRLNQLAAGEDGRNRCLLSAFGSKTGRNQPSTAKCIFGPAVWLRGLMGPGPGMAVAYIDYEQQEFGIGAALSKDPVMTVAYTSGDPYLAFAKQADAVPMGATKHSHGRERDQFKQCALGVQYGMEADSLARRLGKDRPYASRLLRLHRETYPNYWNWSDGIRDFAMLSSKLQTVFGWAVHVGQNPNARSLRNFPLQGNGAEMLRLASCMATERGIRVCWPVHDALLIEAPIADIEDAVRTTQAIMEEASRMVLGGFTIRTDAKIIRYPDHYIDARGEKMWATVMDLLGGSDV